MLKEAISEAQKYETARRRELKRHHEAKDRERENHLERMKALRAALSPAAARIVVAAEGNPFHEAAPSGFVGEGIGDALLQAQRDAAPDPNPAPAWLNEEPPPLPAGALLEVEHKPRKRA